MSIVAELEDGTVLAVPLSRVRPAKDSPRANIDQARLHELADSIRTIGQQEPILVRPVADDPAHDYEIVKGERRWRACEIAGKSHVTVIVRKSLSNDEQLLLSLAMNCSRVELTAQETALALRCAMEGGGLDARKLSECCGVSLRSVSDLLLTLDLPPEVLAKMNVKADDGEPLSAGIGVRVANLPGSLQDDLAGLIRKRRASKSVEKDAPATAEARLAPVPEGDFRGLMVLLARMYAVGAPFLGMSSEEFGKMITERTPEERTQLWYRIERWMSVFGSFLWELRDDEPKRDK